MHLKQWSITILALVMCVVLSGCGPSPEDLVTQTAVAATETAASWTATPKPTRTPTPTKTSTSTPIPSPTLSPTPTPDIMKITLAEVCAGEPASNPEVGTSEIKKVARCNGLGFYTPDLEAQTPSEIHFVLDQQYETIKERVCTMVFEGDTYTTSPYKQEKLTYIVRDVHTGKYVDTKVITGPYPRCPTGCYYNKVTLKLSGCVGGGGYLDNQWEETEKWIVRITQ